MGALTILSWIIAAPLALLFGIFVAEVMFGLIAGRNVAEVQTKTSASVTILIPAHNEALGIASTLQSLAAILPDNADILVVADNCSDQTATIARENGATVIERRDEQARGKGYALAYGRDHLQPSPPDAVIILDADCMLNPGSIEALVREALTKKAPVQSINLVRADTNAPPTVQISNFALLVKNLIRQRGMTRLGGAALLTGTGMAFPWKLFADAPLASADIAEDLSLGVDFTRQGISPQFVEYANVWSDAAAEQDTLEQRTRWEHGFLTTARRYAMPLILSGIGRLSLARLLLGLHLLVPPLALLFMLGAVALFLLGLLVYLGSQVGPLVILGTIFTAAILATMMAWLVEGRAMVSGNALIRIPFYVLWKVPVYLKLVRSPEKQWVRTRRPGEENKED